MSYQRDYRTYQTFHQKKQLVKDEANKKLSGVCAGLAKYYKLPRIVVRIAAVLALITFPVAAGVAYLVATLLLPTR